MLRGFKRIRPEIQLKCFTAVEIAFFADLYGMTDESVLRELQAATGGQGEVWLAAAAMGYTIVPQNPRYAEGKSGGSGAPKNTRRWTRGSTGEFTMSGSSLGTSHRER